MKQNFTIALVDNFIFRTVILAVAVSIVGSFNYICQVAPTAQEHVTYVGICANIFE